MKDFFAFKSKKNMNFFIFFINITIFLYKIEPVFLDTGNNIEQIQNFTRVTKYTDIVINYAALCTTPNGDLLCISSYYTTSTTYYSYGLKKNGRSYFLNNGEETPYKTINSDVVRNEGNIFAIKLNSTSNEDKEYVITFGNNNANFELYDFDDNNKIYKVEGKTFFGTSSNPFHYSTIFKLKNEQNTYIISIIGKIGNNFNFILMKIIFYNKDISSYSPIKTSISESCAEVVTSCCFESKNNFIFCFYLKDSSNYKISVYHYNLTELASTSITPIYYSDKMVFYRSVHFTEDAGAFIYMDTDNNFEIQFK